MTALLQRLFFLFMILGCSLTNVYGQNTDGADDTEKGGIFKDKKKIETDGGGANGDCTSDYSFSIIFETLSSDFPCELYMGVELEGENVQYSPVWTGYVSTGLHESQLYNGAQFTIPEGHGCSVGEGSISVLIDLYCKLDDGSFRSINICRIGAWDDIFPPSVLENCSIAFELEVDINCCTGDTDMPDTTTEADPRNMRECIDKQQVQIFSFDGRMVYQNLPLVSNAKIPNIKTLPIPSGLYIVRIERCGNIETTKIFKN